MEKIVATLTIHKARNLEAQKKWHSSKLLITFCLTFCLPVGAFGAGIKHDAKLVEAYKAVHQKHLTAKVTSIIDTVSLDQAWIGLLMTNKNFTRTQADSVVDHVVKGVDSCWQETFLSDSTEAELKKVISAYKSGKTQFIDNKVPKLDATLQKCSPKLGIYLEEKVNYIIANN
jgi:hypothetical protein